LDKSNSCIEASTALPGCQVIDSKHDDKCKLCFDGYELQNDGTCKKIYEYKECGGVQYNYCLSCSKTDSSQCGECRPGYELGEGECFKRVSGSMSLGKAQVFILLMNILIWLLLNFHDWRNLLGICNCLIYNSLAHEKMLIFLCHRLVLLKE